MMLCKQAEKGVPLQAEQADWLADTNEEIDEQELEAHYNSMAGGGQDLGVTIADSRISDTGTLEKVQYNAEYNVFSNERQHSKQPGSISNTCIMQKVDSNVIPGSPNMCDNDIQTDQNAEDERVALANLIANLKLDTELETYKTLNDSIVDYDKLERKLNETLGLLAQKEIDIKEGSKLKAYKISVVKEKHDELVKQSVLTKSYYEGLVKEKTKVITDLKLKEEKDIDKMISMEKQLNFLNEIIYKRNQSIQTIHMLAPKCPAFNGRPTFSNPVYLKKAQSEKPCLYEILFDTSDPANRFIPDREETLTLEKDRVTHRINVSRPQTRNTQMKDKVVPNINQVKYKKTEVEDHHSISSISNQTKFVTACNDNLKSRTSNVNDVCATCGKCVFNSNHDACVYKFLNDVNARTKKPNIVPISTRKPKSQANKPLATPRKKTVASYLTITNSKSYYRMLYEKTSKA
ncbi:hypothetical protein Tco_1447641 [Tanacetum coccineum]